MWGLVKVGLGEVGEDGGSAYNMYRSLFFLLWCGVYWCSVAIVASADSRLQGVGGAEGWLLG